MVIVVFKFLICGTESFAFSGIAIIVVIVVFKFRICGTESFAFSGIAITVVIVVFCFVFLELKVLRGYCMDETVHL